MKFVKNLTIISFQSKPQMFEIKHIGHDHEKDNRMGNRWGQNELNRSDFATTNPSQWIYTLYLSVLPDFASGWL